jgi:hypothetical protein
VPSRWFQFISAEAKARSGLPGFSGNSQIIPSISPSAKGARRISADALVLLQAALRQTFYECYRFARLMHAASPAAQHQAPFPSSSRHLKTE